MKLIEKFEYNEIESVTHENGNRFYQVDGNDIPSVTTIIKNTESAADKQALSDWRKRVGNEEADRISEKARNMGTFMHAVLENRIAGLDEKPETTGNPMQDAIADKMAGVILEQGLKNVSETWGVEVPVHYKAMYAGRTDCIGLHNGMPSIIDFKNSRKRKKREYSAVQNYLMQLTAYAKACNKMFGLDIAKGVIMVAMHDGDYQEFVLDGDEFEEYAMKWAIRVRQYHGMES